MNKKINFLDLQGIEIVKASSNTKHLDKNSTLPLIERRSILNNELFFNDGESGFINSDFFNLEQNKETEIKLDSKKSLNKTPLIQIPKITNKFESPNKKKIITQKRIHSANFLSQNPRKPFNNFNFDNKIC